ncbi:AMP-binding protein [Streptomyces sp. INA 01156]
MPAPSAGAVPVPASLVARLLDRFREQPDAVAVDTTATVDAADTLDAAGASLSYGALDRASALLAARLRALGVRPGDLVGLLTEPGADTVVGVVGILRAGQAGSRSTRSIPSHA